MCGRASVNEKKKKSSRQKGVTYLTCLVCLVVGGWVTVCNEVDVMDGMRARMTKFKYRRLTTLSSVEPELWPGGECVWEHKG